MPNPILPKDLKDSSASPILPTDAAPTQIAPATVTVDEGAESQEEESHQAAFDASYQWRGKELHPWSIGRESLFYQFRNAVGASDMDAALVDIDAFLADALRILWLCSHLPSDFRRLRPHPTLMQEAVEEWAEKNVTKGQHSAATSLALQIFNDAGANIATPSDTSEESGN